MGPRGFRVSLAQTATKEDCIEVQFSASEITSCYRHAKHGTTIPSPPPGREGFSLIWTILGFASRQDTVFGLSLSMVYNFIPVFPNRVWSV